MSCIFDVISPLHEQNLLLKAYGYLKPNYGLLLLHWPLLMHMSVLSCSFLFFSSGTLESVLAKDLPY